jgi:DHA1 family inner membrane transport protein
MPAREPESFAAVRPPDQHRTPTTRSAALALVALAVGTFAIGTTEFVITGVLPEVAHDLRTSIASAGLLVSGYALGVVAGAPLMTALASRLPRKPMLLILLVFFIAGNAICAVSPSFTVMMAGRVVTSLCHGAFIGIATVVAAHLVPAHRKASAIAGMLAGLTIANVAGVPLGTFLGQRAGWRVTFLVIAALGVLAVLAIAAWVPSISAEQVALRTELRAFRSGRLWLALLITALGFGAVYAPFTYVAGLMTVAGFAASALPWLLVLFGVGLVIGNVLGGRAADRRLVATVITVLSLLTGLLAVFFLTVHGQLPAAVTLFLLGLIGFATVPGLTALVLSAAGGGAANTMAASAAVAAFNVGNATGAYLASRVIGGGHGYPAITLAGAAMAAIAVLVAIASSARRSPPM